MRAFPSCKATERGHDGRRVLSELRVFHGQLLVPLARHRATVGWGHATSWKIVPIACLITWSAGAITGPAWQWRDLRIASAEIGEPGGERKIDLRVQVIELPLHSPEPGTDVSRYLLPEIATQSAPPPSTPVSKPIRKTITTMAAIHWQRALLLCLVRFLPPSG
jgi:hypothetical protein